MHAYYFDPTLPGDQRAPHDSNRPFSLDQLKFIGAAHWSISVDRHDWEENIDEVAREMGYKNRDVRKAGLGEAYESKLLFFF